MRALIVDDDYVKAQFVDELCQKYIPGISVMFAPSLSSANLNTKIEYDLVLCDRQLGDGVSDSFIERYASAHPDTKIISYSAIDDPREYTAGIMTYPFSAVKGEISDFSRQNNDFVKQEKGVVEMGDLYSKELCLERHAHVEKKQAEFTSLLEKISSRLESFDKNSRAVLISVVLCLLALVGNFVLQLAKAG